MVRYKAGLALTAAALATMGSAPALAQAANNTQVIKSVGLADLQQFVLLRGDSVVETGKSGVVSVLAKAKDGIQYSLTGTACNQRGVVGCEAIFMQVKFTATPAVTDATLAKANAAYAALKIWRDDRNTVVGVSRYEILRDGVTRQNVVDNIDLLVGLAPAAAQLAFGKAPPKPAAPKPAAK